MSECVTFLLNQFVIGETTVSSASSQRSARVAGWTQSGDPRPPGTDAATLGAWKALLNQREHPKWDQFSWLTVRALFESVNDQLAKLDLDLVLERRARWIAAQRAAGAETRFRQDFIVDRTGDRSFFLIGDPGEQDASQYAVVPVLTGAADVADSLGPTQFTVIVSDVVYPAGDVNEYVNAFYIPYADYDRPIYALPGNHDWYDGLNGFMYHFCGADPLPVERFRASSLRPGKRLLAQLWRGSSVPERNHLTAWRSERPDAGDGLPGLQPAPYFAIDTEDLLIVAIDTGVTGEIDDEQGDWLVRISRRRKHKILLTGKPIYVDNEYHPCVIRWSESRCAPEEDGWTLRTVDDVIRHPNFGYLAAVGGDVHNYQRYPVRLTEPNQRDLLYLVSGGGGAYLSPTQRIPVVGGEPSKSIPDDATWPAGVEMPREWRPDEAQPPGRSFRCYPRRGDSLAYAARTAIPRLFSVVTAGTAAFCVAAYLYTDAIPAPGSARLGTLAFYGGLAAAIGVLLLTAKLWHRPGVRTSARFSVMVLLAITAMLGVVWVVSRFGNDLLTSGPFWIAFGISLAVPALIVTMIIAAYELRGSLPSAPADLLPGATTMAAVWVAMAVPRTDWAPRWFIAAILSALGVALVTALTRALRAAEDRRRIDAPSRAGSSSRFVFERLLVALPPVALCGALAVELDTDWLPRVAIASSVAFAIAWTLAPRTRGDAQRSPGWWSFVDDTARFVAIGAWLGVVLSLADEIGNGWPADGMATGASGLVIVTMTGILVLLALDARLKRAGICLVIAGLVLALALDDVPGGALVISSAGLVATVAILFWPLRSGTLNADRADFFVAGRLGTVPRRESAGDPVNGELTVSRLIQGQKLTGQSAVTRVLAELADADRPPFFKNFLRCDVLDAPVMRSGHDRTLRIRCFGVTGYASEETDPPCEDRIEIRFKSRHAYPTDGVAPPPRISAPS
jgi:hypothetical protein